MQEGTRQDLEELSYLEHGEKEPGKYFYLSHFYSQSAVAGENIQKHKWSNLKWQ